MIRRITIEVELALFIITNEESVTLISWTGESVTCTISQMIEAMETVTHNETP